MEIDGSWENLKFSSNNSKNNEISSILSKSEKGYFKANDNCLFRVLFLCPIAQRNEMEVIEKKHE